MARGRELRLRPLGFTDVLDETVELFRSNFWLLVGITAAVEIPINLVNPTKSISALSSGKFDPMAVGGYMATIFLWFFVYIVVVLPLLTGALTGAISERYLSRQATIVDSYKRVLKPNVFGRLIWANLIIGFFAGLYYIVVIAVFAFALGGFGAMGGFDSTAASVAVIILAVLLFMAAMAPLVWFLIATLLAPAAVLLESLSGWQAVKRSMALTKGMIWSILGAYLLVSIVAGVLQSVLLVPAQLALVPGMMMGASSGAFELPFWFNLIAAIVGSVFAPLVKIIVVLFYYDARVRKEGFDLVMLAEQLDKTGGARVAFGETSHPQERDESWRVSDMDRQEEASKPQSFELGEPEARQQEWGTEPTPPTALEETTLPTEESAPSSDPEQPSEKPKDEPG